MDVCKNMCPNCFEIEYEKEFCPKCGYRTEYEVRSEAALPVGIILNERYLIGKVLGIGGFGITYKSCDMTTGGICAIKEYFPSGMVGRMDDKVGVAVRANELEPHYNAGLEQFIQEAQILSRLGQIPSVVRIFDCFTMNKTAYFTMEYLDGATLKQIIKTAKSRLLVQEVLDIVIQVAMAMDIIHKKANILHLDISPDNIYITKDKQVKLIDFGSAKQNIAKKGRESLIQVKLKYAPPEQYSPEMKQGTYTDVYALVSTCYYALTGTFLPTAADRLRGKAYVPLKQLNIEVGEKVSDVLDHALELKYQDRTQSMQDLIEGLTSRVIVPAPKEAFPKAKRSIEKNKKIPYAELFQNGKVEKYWVLPLGTEIKIGRTPSENHIVIAGHPDISKVHCIIMFDNTQDTFFVKDVSRNGTLIKGIRLKKDVTYKVGSGENIALASERCMVKVGIKYEHD